MKSKLLIIVALMTVVNAKASDWWQEWSSNMEYADQSALEADWPKNPSDPYAVAAAGVSALTLTSEQNHSAGGSKCGKSKTVYQFSEHNFGQLNVGTITVWMYDPMTSTTGNNFGVAEAVRGTGYCTIGVVSPISQTNYTYRTDLSGGWIATSIARTQGWHKIVFTFGVQSIGGSIYFDDQLVAGNTTMSQGVWAIEVGNKWQVDSVETFYWDDISYQPTELLNPYSDTRYGTGGLWHLDSQSTGTAGQLTADDDSLNASRNHDMLFKPDGYAPTLEPSFVPSLGNCAYFDGMGNYLGATTDMTDTLDLEGDNFRIECWAKIGDPTSYASPGTNYNYTMMCHYRRCRLSLADTVNGWLLAFTVNDTKTTGATLNEELYLLPAFDMSTWHHYAAEFYHGTMKIYVDGVLQKTWTASFTTTVVPEQSFYIGDLGAGQTTYRFYGWLDEVRYSQAVPTAPACGYWGYLAGDINRDCYVNLKDIAEFATFWLTCSIPNQPECNQF